MFLPNQKIVHKKFGPGSVVTDMGASVVVRFDTKIEICATDELEVVPDVYDAFAANNISPLSICIPALQAKCIKSINDQWGVFARTKIELLPHQLWVCRQARKKNPCRLLVADDVGLGKTIEAGIILSAFMSTGRIRRLLVLTPASLAEQWQQRMYNMFDIRLIRYMTELDTGKSAFWQATNMVVASIDTLRLDHNGRQERLLASDPWDLVIVDEAHHLNCDQKQGPTLGYNFIQTMLKNEKINSMIFFTGTPHKGKNFSFLSLMKLLDSEVFNPKGSLAEHLGELKNYMIRNNKYNVTDLRGNRLFSEPDVFSTTYSYSVDEQIFYETLTEFISSGMAYASGLNHETGRIVMFVLITMQKLASSSVAAIRHALQKRVDKYKEAESRSRKLKHELEILENLEDSSLDDKRAQIEEELLELSDMIELGADEESSIQTLLNLAERITDETKIRTILQVIQNEYPDEQILFFTEYKATQSALMTALMTQYGENSVTFINGDERLEKVKLPNGETKRIAVKRETASTLFNTGQRRFLIATEAAGEGIDLQKKCHILFHVDLPWNPMRLHQRVGRLNRYGQQKKVIVRNFRNPETVESRIWDKLNEKLAKINETFSAVMEDKEDMFQLVLGMTSPSVFSNLFAGAPQKTNEETLSKWFDSQTSTIGGHDVFNAVQAIAGNASKFDYRQVSKLLPYVDLPDLLPFWKNLLSMKGRRLTRNGDSLEFLTPDDWNGFGVMKKYNNLTLSRTPDDGQVILGVGHIIFDKGLDDALTLQAGIGVSCNLEHNILVFSVVDQLTDGDQEKLSRVIAVEISTGTANMNVLADWELLKLLNQLPVTEKTDHPAVASDIVKTWEEQGKTAILQYLKNEENAPKIPVFTLEAVLFNGKTDSL